MTQVMHEQLLHMMKVGLFFGAPENIMLESELIHLLYAIGEYVRQFNERTFIKIAQSTEIYMPDKIQTVFQLPKKGWKNYFWRVLGQIFKKQVWFERGTYLSVSRSMADSQLDIQSYMPLHTKHKLTKIGIARAVATNDVYSPIESYEAYLVIYYHAETDTLYVLGKKG